MPRKAILKLSPERAKRVHRKVLDDPYMVLGPKKVKDSGVSGSKTTQFRKLGEGPAALMVYKTIIAADRAKSFCDGPHREVGLLPITVSVLFVQFAHEIQTLSSDQKTKPQSGRYIGVAFLRGLVDPLRKVLREVRVGKITEWNGEKKGIVRKR